MKQEEKQLLLQDLCARLSYGIKCKNQYGDYINVSIYNAHIEHLIDQILSGVVQMVLRPMSSMTEEEKIELRLSAHSKDSKMFRDAYFEGNYKMQGKVIPHFAADWCNAHHFDYGGLIEKGLALEAPEGMYNVKEK